MVQYRTVHLLLWTPTIQTKQMGREGWTYKMGLNLRFRLRVVRKKAAAIS